ncbi:response regulator transcription factor [Cryobacterium sp. TMT1-3]|uniref:helix-turn-helix transcriptional regulator n=1 Tax=Cryobacterium sp. TMT1-3 TaxID=1259237 RepID=UPI00106BF9FD|nr:LuxR C-terminal-related transcriptional regulator [Cryobacterium sp. TMT1-3]TFC29129.1 response regulator transcription factor [Cryobacterium sp. TMT1-3]
MTTSGNSFFRPSDNELLRGAMRTVSERIGIEVMLGGLVDRGALTLTEFVGTSTRSLVNAKLYSGVGIGGSVMRLGKPVSVAEYATSNEITHHYDLAVEAEGLRAVVGIPVVVNGVVRSVFYCASRSLINLGDRLQTHLADYAAKIAREVEIRDEVDRRVSMLRIATQSTAITKIEAARAESLRHAFAKLREIARTVDDPELAARIADVSAGLKQFGPVPAHETPLLSARELDVVSLVALGCSNAEIATRLSIQVVTVKKYLQHAMQKLAARRRLEAVVTARSLGLIP